MKDAIRWLLLIIVIAAVGSGIYYRYQDIRPCNHPIQYAIGAVDARFGIKNSALVTESKAAAEIWNKTAGKTVITYDPKAGMKINLIYDEREANAKLGSQIARQQSELDNERAALDAAQAKYTDEQAAYNQAVSAVNARGGATRREAEILNAQRASLNALAVAINNQVSAFNDNVRALNDVVAQFNKTAGRTFKEGEYVQNNTGRRINIFEFVGNTQLERVLAHEFGHALGLDHNDDPKSIMFAKNESGNLTPTAADLAALRSLCGM